MTQAPMISVPLKATNEIDWIAPLKKYIQNTYGDDPERYVQECETLNRLRQDMRGASKDSTAGRDLLYRYYGQLELLDLRFPVDEQNIKIAFTWFDAFTHKPTCQHSLAFEKASIIFNISAVLSCHAADQSRSTEAGLKMAYHSFQASAGMFTYINENFLHAPSADLNRNTVKTLVQIMLAQAQEVFLEKQIADDKKPGLLAKLASQAASLYEQTVEGVQENMNQSIFEKAWYLMVQSKFHLMSSMAQYYQAVADNDANSHGLAIGRLKVADFHAKEACKIVFPGSIPPSSNLNTDCGSILAEITKRQRTTVDEMLRRLIKENDTVYYQEVPSEAGVQPVAKLQAAKPIPVSELYAGQDIQRITGPDLFSKIVPLAVTESASLYDEEKAKLVRAETERVDQANSELAASLDYLRLPGALQILKEGVSLEISSDQEFRSWCADVADHEPPADIFAYLDSEKRAVIATLDKIFKQLDMEESVCEKMRSKYKSEWTQQPSSRLTTTLRSDIRNYREALDEAAKSDGQLAAKLRMYNDDIQEMKMAAETGEADNFFRLLMERARAKSSNVQSPAVAEANLLDADFETGPSVMEQVKRLEEILKKLNLIKKERVQVLRDLKEKAHNDDISQILILNKKSITHYEQQLFRAELEKYRPHQNRLMQASHKQTALMKELTITFNALLQDKRVRAENNKYESMQRQRNLVMNKYKRVYQEFLDLETGLQSARNWYKEMKETVQSLEKNVETFVNNRRAEGAQLLNQIEQERLRGLMDRMSMEQPTSPQRPPSNRPSPAPLPFGSPPLSYPKTNFAGQYQVPKSPPPTQTSSPQLYNLQQQQSLSQGGHSYNPSFYGRVPGPVSPPPTQTSFTPGLQRHGPASPTPAQTSFSQQQQPRPYSNGYSKPAGVGSSAQPTHVPPGFVPPPPPPGPPPLGPQQTFHYNSTDYYNSPSAQQQQGGRPPSGQQTQSDPWAGLSAWK